MQPLSLLSEAWGQASPGADCCPWRAGAEEPRGRARPRGWGPRPPPTPPPRRQRLHGPCPARVLTLRSGCGHDGHAVGGHPRGARRRLPRQRHWLAHGAQAAHPAQGLARAPGRQAEAGGSRGGPARQALQRVHGVCGAQGVSLRVVPPDLGQAPGPGSLTESTLPPTSGLMPSVPQTQRGRGPSRRKPSPQQAWGWGEPARGGSAPLGWRPLSGVRHSSTPRENSVEGPSPVSRAWGPASPKRGEAPCAPEAHLC